MRRSGEAEAIDDDGDLEQERRPAEPVGDPVRAAGTSARAYPVWLKIEPAKRKLAPVPEYLSRQTWARLSRQIAAYLRSRLNNNLTLRDAVRLVEAEMRLAGAGPNEIAAALGAAVAEHPELTTLDRTNVVTRRLASEELLDRMLHWVER